MKRFFRGETLKLPSAERPSERHVSLHSLPPVLGTAAVSMRSDASEQTSSSLATRCCLPLLFGPNDSRLDGRHKEQSTTRHSATQPIATHALGRLARCLTQG